MAEKVVKVGIKREEGWLYFIDKKGDISRVRMARGGKKKKKTVKKKAVKKKTVKKKAVKKKIVKRKVVKKKAKKRR